MQTTDWKNTATCTAFPPPKPRIGWWSFSDVDMHHLAQPHCAGGGGNKSTNSYENDPVRSRQAVVDVNYVWDVLCPSRIQVSTAAYVPCDVEGRRITASKIPYLSLFSPLPWVYLKKPGHVCIRGFIHIRYFHYGTGILDGGET